LALPLSWFDFFHWEGSFPFLWEAAFPWGLTSHRLFLRDFCQNFQKFDFQPVFLLCVEFLATFNNGN
jgi:hypothetical protein